MSMKFFSGIQDLIGGLYDAASSQGITSPTSGQVPSQMSPSSPIPPSTHFGSTSGAGLIGQQPRKRSANDINMTLTNDDELEPPVTKCSHDRRVRFPDEHDELITGFSEAPVSPFLFKPEDEPPTQSADTTEMIERYRHACVTSGIAPSNAVERQIGFMHQAPGVRQESLSLKGEPVSHLQMEALEEIFRRVQFESLDFEYTFLEDEAAVALGEMLEFYESTHKLNLSFNKLITMRGWNAIFKAVKNCHSLQVLNLRYTSLTDKSLPLLCRALRNVPPPALACLHLENVALSGKNLLLVVCALKTNTVLKELYLGENNLQGTDGAHLYQLIVANSSIQMLDLRNNHLGDGGLRHICDALRSRDAKEKSALTALVLWNNKITGASMDSLALALKENQKLETLNIGSNHIGVGGIQGLKLALASNTNLHRLGLQSTNMDCQGAIILAECLADNNVMVRVDLRDNPAIGSAGLLALHSAMKMNTSITLMNLDQSCALASSNKDAFCRYFDEIKEFCVRNKAAAMARLTAKVANEVAEVEEDRPPSSEATSPTLEEPVLESKCANCSANCRGSVSSEDGEVTSSEAAPEATQGSSESSKSEIGDNSSAPPLSPTDCPSCSNATKPASSRKRQDSESSSSTTSRRPLGQPSASSPMRTKFARSSSLTCAETVADIHERIRVMSGSTHSLDDSATTSSGSAVSLGQVGTSATTAALAESSNADSMKTIRRNSAAAHVSLSKAEWTSLPDLPKAVVAETAAAAKPEVRKLRRFSVSPSSSVFDVSKPAATAPKTLETIPCKEGPATSSTPASVTSPTSPNPLRPQSLAIEIPARCSAMEDGPQSAPVTLINSAPPVFSPTSPSKALPEASTATTQTATGSVREQTPAPLPSSSSSCRDGSRESSAESTSSSESEEQLVAEVKGVVNDLVNYIVYEETSVAERKVSMLLTTTFAQPPDPKQLLLTLDPERRRKLSHGSGGGGGSSTTSTATPSRMMSVVDEFASPSDEEVVQSVVRQLVRDVLQTERDSLRGTINHKRTKLSSRMSPTPSPMTPSREFAPFVDLLSSSLDKTKLVKTDEPKEPTPELQNGSTSLTVMEANDQKRASEIRNEAALEGRSEANDQKRDSESPDQDGIKEIQEKSEEISLDSASGDIEETSEERSPTNQAERRQKYSSPSLEGSPAPLAPFSPMEGSGFGPTLV